MARHDGCGVCIIYNVRIIVMQVLRATNRVRRGGNLSDWAILVSLSQKKYTKNYDSMI